MRICLHQAFSGVNNAISRELKDMIFAALRREDKASFNVDFKRDQTGDFVDVTINIVKPMEFIKQANTDGDGGNRVICSIE